MGTICSPCKMQPMRVRLSEFRNKLGLTLEQMAERADYSVSQLSRWEAHKSNIPSKNLPKLAQAYGCRVSEVFAEDWEQADQEISESDLRQMIADALLEVPPGTPLSGYPPIVASSLHDQLALFRAHGAFQDSSDAESAQGKAAPPPAPTKRGAPVRSRTP